jgi:hypothetical protein
MYSKTTTIIIAMLAALLAIGIVDAHDLVGIGQQITHHGHYAIAAIAPLLSGDYLTEQELADQLARSLRTIKRWRAERAGPAYTLIGKTVVYRRSGIPEWLRAQEQPTIREARRKDDSRRERGKKTVRGRS